MAQTGIPYELTEQDKKQALKYVEQSGFFKSRLADFLEISRPTLDKVLEEQPGFFTAIKRADSVFCKKLIDTVGKKNPIFLLRTKYKEEFNEDNKYLYDPQDELRKLKQMLDVIPE